MFIYTDLSVNDTPAPPSATQIHAIHRDPSCDAGDAAHQLRRAESRKFYWGRGWMVRRDGGEYIYWALVKCSPRVAIHVSPQALFQTDQVPCNLAFDTAGTGKKEKL